MISVYLFLGIFAFQLLTTAHCQSEQKNASEIYGVRWFLAESFRYKQFPDVGKAKSSKSQDLMGMFNSQTHNQGTKYYISIQNETFPCYMKQVHIQITENFHSNFNNLSSKIGQSFQTFVYRCPIGFNQQNFLEERNSFQYKIWSQLQKQKNKLFQSTLKSPKFKHRNLKAVVLGDWGKIDKQSAQKLQLVTIDQCLSSRIKNNEVNLMILLGDLGYDMQGLTYINFLTYLQTFSQYIPILFTPGNHQSMKHPNIYQLTKETFYSPFWSDYNGYFQLVKIGRYLFIGYSPDSQFGSSIYTQMLLQKQGNHPQFFKKQFTQHSIADIYANYTTIAFSHYPIFCSQQNKYDYCSQYQSIQVPYLEVLKRLGIDLMLSAHLHLYQRSKPICFNEKDFLESEDTQELDTYQLKSCPVFIIDGAAGNNYFVMNEPIFEFKNFSRKYVGNTGFGLLTLNTQSETNRLQFQQISAKRQCRVEDHFIMKSKPQKAQLKFSFVVIGITCFVFILSLGFYLIFIKNKGISRSPSDSKSTQKIDSNWELEDIKY